MLAGFFQLQVPQLNPRCLCDGQVIQENTRNKMHPCLIIGCMRLCLDEVPPPPPPPLLLLGGLGGRAAVSA
jgi:hypothetical protein